MLHDLTNSHSFENMELIIYLFSTGHVYWSVDLQCTRVCFSKILVPTCCRDESW